MSKKARHIILDIILTCMLIFEMLYQFTGNALHEYVGFAFFVCIIIHLVFERKWLFNTFVSLCTKKLNKRRKVLSVIALLLTIDIIILGASSLIISNTLWNIGLDLSFANPGNIWVPIHTASSYALCVIVAGHLASHWTLLAKQMHIEYNPARRQAIGTAVNATVGLGILALGITGYTRVAEAINNEQLINQKLSDTTQDNSNSTRKDTSNMRQNNDSNGAPHTKTETESSSTSQNNNTSSSQGTSGSTTSKSKSNSRSSKSDRQNSSPSNDASPSATPSSPSPSSPAQGSNQENTNSQNNNSSNNTNTSNEGTCTLCRKYCSLSNPRCDKPYRAGLI